jgi:CRISPR/Cas system-associated endonuclease Cas1
MERYRTQRLYFVNRSSLLSHGLAKRHAVDPANVILRFANVVLEGQTRQALSATSFDLTCGFLHADRRGRDALV